MLLTLEHKVMETLNINQIYPDQFHAIESFLRSKLQNT